MPKCSKTSRMIDNSCVFKPAASGGWVRCALLGALLCWPVVTHAGRDIGQDEALRLVEQGTIESLNVFIADALERFPGRFLQAELELDDGRYIYEIEIVTQERRVMELEYDAATRELLDVDEDD